MTKRVKPSFSKEFYAHGSYIPQLDNTEKSAILQKLKYEKMHSLYHFTSVSNLEGIALNAGLCSVNCLQSIGQSPSDYGGNGVSQFLDQQLGNLDYIHLNFFPYTPMAYHTKQNKHLCFFHIDPEVASWDGVMFTDSNATKTGHLKEKGLAGLNLVDFSYMKTVNPGDPNWVKYSQAEVLVPQVIPLSSVMKVSFVSEASLEEGKRVWGDSTSPEFVVDKSPFKNNFNSFSQVEFPHIHRITITPDKINRSNCKKTHPSQVIYRKETEQPTILMYIWVRASTKGVIEYISGEKIAETTFVGPKFWFWFPAIPIDYLRTGDYYVRIRLNGVDWGTKVFRVIS